MDAISPLFTRMDSSESRLIELLKNNDASTDAHSTRVAEITAEWMSYLKSRDPWLDLDEMDLVLAARLHDVGKIGVQKNILNKAGPLTALERKHLETHADLGYQLLCTTELTGELALAVRHHHERWDGTGYPLGLQGEQIPVFAQIIAIVDAFDAITSDRPYREARDDASAILELQNAAGCQFSPAWVESFVKFLHARNT